MLWMIARATNCTAIWWQVVVSSTYFYNARLKSFSYIKYLKKYKVNSNQNSLKNYDGRWTNCVIFVLLFAINLFLRLALATRLTRGNGHSPDLDYHDYHPVHSAAQLQILVDGHALAHAHPWLFHYLDPRHRAMS